MRFPLRRVLLGFAVGAAAGWAGGLLRRPTSAPEGSSADEALHLPQEEFGSPAGEERADDEQAVEGAEEIAQEPTAPPAAYETPAPDEHETPPPRKATPPTVKRPPGSRKTRAAAAEGHDGASEPATAPEAGEEQVKPRRSRAKKAVADPHVDAAAALREGHAAATERLADAEAVATPPPDPNAPARRRRRPATGT